MPNLDRLVVEQLLKQQLSKLTTEPVINDLFSLQRQVLQDASTRKALLIGRRGGKTHLVLAALLVVAITEPKSNCLYIAPSREQGKRLLWNDLLAFDQRYNLKLDFNHSELTAKLSNGSILRVAGCHTLADADSFRGQRYRIVCIDEAGHFGEHLRYLITDALGPALRDYPNTALWLVGTPNITSTGLFHDVTNTDLFPNWRTWKWTLADNPKLPRWSSIQDYKDQGLPQQLFSEICQEEHCTPESPYFRREYLAQWHRDHESAVLSWRDESNTFVLLELPENSRRYIIGVDDGVMDEFAIALCCYSPDHPNFYVLDTFQGSQLSYTEKTDRIRLWSDQYHPELITTDPAAGGSQLILDLSTKYKLPIHAAKKRTANKGRLERIEMFNDDVRRGLVKVHSSLWSTINELKNLTWKDRTKAEIAGKDHVFDAIRYAFHESGHIYFEQPEPPKPHTMADFWERQKQRIKDEQMFEQILFGGFSE